MFSTIELVSCSAGTFSREILYPSGPNHTFPAHRLSERAPRGRPTTPTPRAAPISIVEAVGVDRPLRSILRRRAPVFETFYQQQEPYSVFIDEETGTESDKVTVVFGVSDDDESEDEAGPGSFVNRYFYQPSACAGDEETIFPLSEDEDEGEDDDEAGSCGFVDELLYQPSFGAVEAFLLGFEDRLGEDPADGLSASESEDDEDMPGYEVEPPETDYVWAYEHDQEALRLATERFDQQLAYWVLARQADAQRLKGNPGVGNDPPDARGAGREAGAVPAADIGVGAKGGGRLPRVMFAARAETRLFGYFEVPREVSEGHPACGRMCRMGVGQLGVCKSKCVWVAEEMAQRGTKML